MESRINDFLSEHNVAIVDVKEELRQNFIRKPSIQTAMMNVKRKSSILLERRKASILIKPLSFESE